MKIGLIGAPGSGKTALGDRLASELGLELIDEYVYALEDETDYVYGKYATYAGNIHIGLRRHAIERCTPYYVTCGTMIDTVTYMAAKVSIAEDQPDARRLTGGLVVLGCMVEDMMDYDHLFLLPSQPGDPFLAEVAQGLEEAVDLFHVDFTLLDQPTIEERVEKALAHINGPEDTSEAASAE